MKKIICLLMVIVMISGFPSEAAAAEDFSHVHKELPFSAGKKAGSYSLITRASCSRARLIAARTSRGGLCIQSRQAAAMADPDTVTSEIRFRM